MSNKVLLMKSLSAFTLLFIFFNSLNADVSFITESEYASQLYHSPRGIGCFKCHGEKGEGKLIATYKDKGEKMSFSPPAINKLDFKSFNAAMKKGKVVFTENCKYPLLVVSDSGSSRSAAFASDVAPHWVGPLVDWGDARINAQAPGAGEIEVGNWYAQFFANLINWLCCK